ncbi:MAG: hypothetical protein R3C11_02775 [Planctomycetaceae bacterium]
MSSSEALYLTRDQVREVDRTAIETYRIPGIVLMENAGAIPARLIAEAGEADLPDLCR